MSIKICVITPISHLKQFGSLGEMDMSLSHLILEDPNGPYAQYYKEQHQKGRFVILDNSAFELEQQGKGLDPDPVLDAAEVTNPSEVIATDCLFDGPATIESTKHFIARMKERGVFGKYRIMGVVQGRTEQEWWKCFHEMLLLPVGTIGLSKLSVPVSFLGEKESPGCVARARLMCTEAIAGGYAARGWLPDYKQVHLLGGDNWTPWEIAQQVQYPWIRSNDSSVAVWYGMQMEFFNEDGKASDIILEKPDLENRDPETEELLSRETRQRMILENIIRWHMAAKGD